MGSVMNYTRYIVSFIDILGFRNLIEREDGDQCDKIKRVLDNFRDINYIANKVLKTDSKKQIVDVRYFSDCVVRLIRVEDHCDWDILAILDHEIGQLALIQVALIELGVFIRGSINMGKVYVDNEIFFGDAFNEAYIHESEKAKYPVIVVSDTLRQYLLGGAFGSSFDIISQLRNEKSNNFAHDQMYVNYLLYMVTNHLFRQDEVAIFVHRHKRIIDEKLAEYSLNEKVLSKYQWLKKYHDHYSDWINQPVKP